MSKLIESILENDFITAQAIFEERIAEIAEKKLYEEKRRIAAMDEAFGGMTQAEIEARKKAGYRRAAEVLGDPDKETELSPAAKKYRATLKKKKKVSEETLDEAGLAASTKTAKIYRAGLKAGRKIGDIYGKYKASKIKPSDDEWNTKIAGDQPPRQEPSKTKTSDEIHGYTPSALKQRITMRKKESEEIRKQKSQEAEKHASEKAKSEREVPAWKRSIGGKMVTSAPSVAKGALGVAKLGGRVLGSMLSGMNE